jgi:predicted Zn-dependent protease
MKALLVTAAIALIAAPAPARACLNEVQLSKDQAVALVAELEKAVETRDWATVDELMEKTQRRPLPREEKALQRRVEIAWATASVRRGRPSWVVVVLADAHRRAPDDPTIQGRYAEALLATGDIVAARKLLEDLAQRDLVTEAESWAALAVLRGVAGDPRGRGQALARCVARAGRLAPQICPAPSA